MRLERLLAKYQKKINLKLSDEYKQISKFRFELDALTPYKDFINLMDSFSLIQCDTIVNSLKNKNYIEELTASLVKESIKDKNFIDKAYITKVIHENIVENSLPYFLSEKTEYYVPFFSRALNYIYSNEQYKLVNEPYSLLKKKFISSLVDLFEVYNFSIYDSNFTHLIKIKQVDNVCAFYHPNFRTIYFINDQGRLDYHICLFDKYLTKINLNHISERVVPVVDAYFANDRHRLIVELIKNDLISEKLLTKIYEKENKEEE